MNKVEELYKKNPEAVLSISQAGGNGVFRVVRAPLPDGFGMSVGSAFTDPNNVDLASQASSSVSGAVGQVMTAASRLSGVSTKMLQRTNVFYDGPEPTEISFDLKFDAYYSAYEEVVRPVAKLMMMSTGSEMGSENLMQYVEGEEAEEQKSNLREEKSNSGRFSALLEGFGLVRAPAKCKIKFGNTFVIPRAYVSSVGVQFSNVLDNQGHPMSAECSVTIKVARNPTQASITNHYFRGVNTFD